MKIIISILIKRLWHYLFAKKYKITFDKQGQPIKDAALDAYVKDRIEDAILASAPKFALQMRLRKRFNLSYEDFKKLIFWEEKLYNSGSSLFRYKESNI